MQPIQSITQLLSRLWRHISLGRFGELLVLMIFASFAEILSIGAVLPFLGASTAPGRVFEYPAVQSFTRFLGLTESKQLLLPLRFGGTP